MSLKILHTLFVAGILGMAHNDAMGKNLPASSERSKPRESSPHTEQAPDQQDTGNTSTFAWMHDLKKATAKAKAEKKPLFVMFRCEP